MNVFTNGETHVVLGPTGLCVHGSGWAERVLDGDGLGQDALGVAPDARTAIVLDREGRAVFVPLDRSAPPEILETRIVTAQAVDAERFACLFIARVKGRDVARFAVGPVPRDGRPRWTVELDPARPNRVDWPSGLLFVDAPAPFSRARCGMDPSRVHIDVNRFGVALADSETGTVAILRPGGRTFEAVHRLPAVDGSVCRASATERGFVASLSTADHAGALVRFDRLGRPLAWVTRERLGPMHVLDDGRLAFVAARGGGETAGLAIVLADADSLEDAETSEITDEVTHGAGARSLSASADGCAIAIGLDEGALVARRGRAGALSMFERLEAPDSRAKSEPPLPPELARASRPPEVLPRVKGPAQLSLDPRRPNDEWSFRAGEPFEIAVPMMSTGGSAEGLYVELAGDAIDSGLIEATVVEAQGLDVVTTEIHVNGSRRPRSEIPGFHVPASVVLPETKKKKKTDRFAQATPDMFLEVRVRGRVKARGRGLLTVRVGFLDGGTTGSLMRGKSIEIA